MTADTAYSLGETVEYQRQGSRHAWQTGRIIDSFHGTITGQTVYVIVTPYDGETGFYADELRPVAAPVAA